MVNGVQYVMMDLELLMLEWLVNNWDIATTSTMIIYQCKWAKNAASIMWYNCKFNLLEDKNNYLFMHFFGCLWSYYFFTHCLFKFLKFFFIIEMGIVSKVYG